MNTLHFLNSIDRFVKHAESCDRNTPGDARCDCGAWAEIEKHLEAELKEAKGTAAVCVNAFKSFQLLYEEKISEQTFFSVIQNATASLEKGADWLNEYVEVAHKQIADQQAALRPFLNPHIFDGDHTQELARAVRAVRSVMKGT